MLGASLEAVVRSRLTSGIDRVEGDVYPFGFAVPPALHYRSGGFRWAVEVSADRSIFLGSRNTDLKDLTVIDKRPEIALDFLLDLFGHRRPALFSSRRSAKTRCRCHRPPLHEHSRPAWIHAFRTWAAVEAGCPWEELPHDQQQSPTGCAQLHPSRSTWNNPGARQHGRGFPS